MLDPREIALHYRHFQVSKRLLFTGHSHQAWPDCSMQAQQRAWLDAAELVDEKWGRAFEKADRVRRGFAALLDDTTGEYTLASSTHDLLVRFLSALPYRTRSTLVTTESEFHSLSRQLRRLEEEGVHVVRVASRPVESVAERLAAAVDEQTAAVFVSAVFFDSGQRAEHLGQLAEATRRVGAELVVDAYHALNVVPFSLVELGLEGAYVLGGGYKYCQLGEGNCFLRFPPECRLRPVFTGWFADFESLAAPSGAHVLTQYGSGGQRFAGSTYDPTSHYRAAEVFDFFARQSMTPHELRALNQHQLGAIVARFDALGLDPGLIDRDRSVSLAQLGGFVTLNTPHAARLCAALRKRGVHTDHRGSSLRIGPAPYITDAQIEDAMAALGEAARELA